MRYFADDMAMKTKLYLGHNKQDESTMTTKKQTLTIFQVVTSQVKNFTEERETTPIGNAIYYLDKNGCGVFKSGWEDKDTTDYIKGKDFMSEIWKKTPKLGDSENFKRITALSSEVIEM